ncbi:MAG: alpha/beta hydrolase, partial [Prevotellaceae bacterium]|nr:alpha/beta hydrolase [Prevotellaceae bacterium]
LNGISLNPEVNGSTVRIPVSLDFGVEYSLVLPAGAFTDTKGANPNLETTINFSTYKTVSTPKGFTTHLDVVYKTIDDWDGRMDLYLPPNDGNPTPIIINMHGGGWNHGEKEQISGFGSIMKHNIAVANVEYRLTPQALAPAAVEDVRCAMLYIINNAKELNVDVNRIVFMGGSAGAHLALTAAYLQENSAYDAGCNKGIPFKVAAVLDRYGPTDLANFFSYKSVVNWLGGQNVDLAKKMSPLYYVNAKTPPTFIVHGDADAIVPYSQSKVLHDALIKAGVKTEFITVEGGGHGNFSKEKKDEVEEALVKFLLNVLR